jgi:hypothetical protein
MAKALPIKDLDARHDGVTTPRAMSYYEAACVCLTRHHVSPVEFSVTDNAARRPCEATWVPASARSKAGWSEDKEATDHGATCCVIAAVEATRGHFAVRRAEIGQGADYYVGPPGAGSEDLEDCYRLEISGVDRGDDQDVQWRLNQKVRQAARGKSSLPATAGVIGFKARRILLKDVKP